jgi:hypothetical protein
MLKNPTQLKWIFFVLVFTIIGFRAANVSVFNSERARNGMLGDGFSDKNTLSSAGYFLDSGFTQTSFLPVHDYFPNDTNYHSVIYTHYPALPNILAGFYAVIFQTKNESLLRVIPILLAMLFFFFIFFVLKQWVKDDRKALLGASSLWLANYFICWGDNIHQHLYGEFLKWLYTYGLYLYHESGQKKKGIWFWLMLIMVVEVNISFEMPVYLGILTLGFSWIYQKKVFSFTTVPAALMVVLGFGLHLAQNASYFGSWQLAIEDMTKAYTFRATGAETIGYIKEREFSWRNIPEIPFDWFNRMERFYLFPGWAVLSVFAMSWRQFKMQYPRLFKISWALFFASISWSLLMAQHAFVHGFTNKHFSTWYALVVAVCLPIYYQRVRVDFAGKLWYKKVFHVLLIAYALGMLVSQQIWEVWIQFGLFFPQFGR